LRTKDEDMEDRRKKEAMLARNAPPVPASENSGPARPGRLSDVMGNRGVMDKVSRVAGE
jgi:hypothetical protein